jgi:biotin carboxylase
MASVNARASVMTKPRLLLVGADPFQLEMLRAARRFAEVAVIDGSAQAPGLALADIARIVDITDVAKVVDVARELQVSGVVTAASDAAVPAVSAVVHALGLPGLGPDAAQRCRDKLLCFQTLSAAGVRVPMTIPVAGATEAERALEKVGGYPAIIKPRRGGGGRGVTLLRRVAELEPALQCARRAYGPGACGVLVQELIAGRAVGVEAFFYRGELACAFVLDDQFEPGYVSPAGHSLPSTLSRAQEQTVVEAVAKLGRSLGIHTGPANFDLRLLHGAPILIEVNPRMGGNSISDLLRHAYGVDLPRATVLAALGHDPRALLSRTKLQPTAARLILKRAHGVAYLNDAPSAFAELEGVVALDLLVQEAECAQVRVDDWTIIGRTLVRGLDSAGAAEFAGKVAEVVSQRIELR